jgi:hypothetical protein
MVELKSQKREMRGDGTNLHEKLGLKRILCASQFTFLDIAGTSPDLVYNNTQRRPSIPNEARLTAVSSYAIVSSTSFSSSF